MRSLMFAADPTMSYSPQDKPVYLFGCSQSLGRDLRILKPSGRAAEVLGGLAQRLARPPIVSKAARAFNPEDQMLGRVRNLVDTG
jgi:hypothetical protein